MEKPYLNFQHAAACEGVLYRYRRGQLTAEEALMELAEQKRQLVQKVILLESIAPKKILTKRGVMIWRCPDELIPIS